MQAANQLQYWLKEFGSLYGKGFSLDEDGTCVLQANDKVTIYLYSDPTGEHYWINVKVMDIPVQNREALFYQALQLNLFQHETRGASLSIDDMANAIFLSLSGRCSDISYGDFKNCLNNLVVAVEDVQHLLAQVVAVPEQPGEQPLGALRI